MTSTHRYPPEVAPDHFVVAAASLEQAVDWIYEDKLGTRVQPGGRHVRWARTTRSFGSVRGSILN